MLTFQPHISCYSWINMRQLILCLISFHAFPFWRCHHKTVGRPGQVWDICDTEYNTDNWDLYDLYDICSEWWGDLTWAKKPLRCCDIWDTNYNTDNWEPEFMTIFVTWQLIATLDSIRNSCDVFLKMQYISIASPQQHPSPWLCSWQCSSRPLQWGGTCRWCTPSGSPQTPAKCPRWRNQDWKSSVFNVCLDV